MICTNKNCGKKFNTPLDLFNGISVCPRCKKELAASSDFKITRRSEETFNNSQLYYYRYLSSSDVTKSNNDKLIALSKPQLLEKAIELCSKAADDGNPKAVFRMGQYNEYYLDTSKSETERMRKAFDCYSAVCFYEKNSVETEKAVKTLTIEEWEGFKRNAAVCLLNLLAKNPNAFKGANKYDYEINSKKLTAIYGTLNVNSRVKKSKNLAKAKSIRQILTSCLSKERAPLFGLYFLTADELKSVFDFKKTEKGKQNFIKFISKGLDVRFLPCTADGLTVDDDGYFTRYKSEDRLKKFVRQVENNEYYYMYFFNTHGKHAYLSPSVMEKVKNELQRNDCELLCKLIDYQSLEYLFFDDDVVAFKKGGIRGSVERLIDYVCGGDL